MAAVLDAIRVPRPGGRGRPRKRPDHLIADTGYSYPRCRSLRRERGIPHTIPERSDQRERRAGRPGRPHGPAAHDGTIIPDRPDAMWGIDATAGRTDEGPATVFIAVDRFTAACVGLRAARRGTRFEALEPLRQGIRERFDGHRAQVAAGLALRHDHGSQFLSDHVQTEPRFLGSTSSPAFVREPEGNGCAARFIRTLKGQLLWIARFDSVEAPRQALLAFKDRYNREWPIQRHGHRRRVP